MGPSRVSERRKSCVAATMQTTEGASVSALAMATAGCHIHPPISCPKKREIFELEHVNNHWKGPSICYSLKNLHAGRIYTVIHLLVVDVSCVLVWDYAHSLGPKQNTRNIYHKQMNNGVMLYC